MLGNRKAEVRVILTSPRNVIFYVTKNFKMLLNYKNKVTSNILYIHKKIRALTLNAKKKSVLKLFQQTVTHQ